MGDAVGCGVPLIDRATAFAKATALVTSEKSWTYQQLLDASARVASRLLADGHDLEERRVCFLVSPGCDYVAVQWGIWRAGGIAVPLGTMHPPPEIDFVLGDASPCAIVVSPEFIGRVESVAVGRGIRVVRTDEFLSSGAEVLLPEICRNRRALMLYTSGTTGRPKGVVTTHANIRSQITSLVQAWEWAREDHILNVLPLHHIHGIINVLSCALWSGAVCEFLSPFDASQVWTRIARGGLTLFMAVPTVYAKLIQAWECASPQDQQSFSAACSQFRLMVSGSAALPVSMLQRWQQISGQVLLERYGMTEIGMALSNLLHGERVPGHVGVPLPEVMVRRVNELGQSVRSEELGEIEVRGPTVFREYWQQPQATEQAFRDGWFRTGDVAVIEDDQYRILGRNSVDIIKTGGYKVSALEIEEVLRTHDQVADCAVVGVEDDEWGQRVAAAVVVRPGHCLTFDGFRAWARDRLATYKAPTRLLTVEALPRNAMGKVSKTEVVKLFEANLS